MCPPAGTSALSIATAAYIPDATNTVDSALSSALHHQKTQLFRLQPNATNKVSTFPLPNITSSSSLMLPWSGSHTSRTRNQHASPPKEQIKYKITASDLSNSTRASTNIHLEKGICRTLKSISSCELLNQQADVFTTGVVIASVAILLPSLSPVSDKKAAKPQRNHQKEKAQILDLKAKRRASRVRHPRGRRGWRRSRAGYARPIRRRTAAQPQRWGLR